MISDWTNEDWHNATRNYIDNQLRHGYFSETTMPKAAKKSAITQSSPVVTNELVGAHDFESIRKVLGACTRCKLSEGRKNIVFGVGNPKADLVVVGEAPGRDEDAQGEPFVGRAGKLLTDILGAIGLSRSDIYICNVIKCRPPQNRPPEPIEVETCSPFLEAQIRAVNPKMICTLGKFASQTLLKTDTPISQLRGNFHDYSGIPLMPTYHPAFLLRNPAAKKEVWEDMKKIHTDLVKITGKNLVRKGN